MFELSQLRCFVAVADELHFGRAAERLNMTQPPLSRQVQLLERILGATLLERTSRSVRLTAAGRAFLLEARRILQLAETASQSTRRIAAGDAGTVALGFTAASGYGLLPRLVTAARARLPQVELALHEMVTSEQVEALVTGRLDVGLLRPPFDRPELMTRRVVAEPLVAALSAGDPRLALPQTELADFDNAPLIAFSPQGAGYFHALLQRLFAGAGVTPLVVQRVVQIHSMLALVQAGIGAAILPEAAVNLHFSDVQFRPLTTEPACPAEIHLAWREDNGNSALRPFLAVASQLADNESAFFSSDGRLSYKHQAPTA